MNCPHCNSDLTGECIEDVFLSQGYSPEEAKDRASRYDDTHFGRQIAQYSMDIDRTIGYRCPDCNGSWDR